MRYAVFTDVHANLEAMEAVLGKIDEIAKEKPIDGIWFLGDLVGYGPNPNECIDKLRQRTEVIIAGNHDWAAVGKIDLEDFSAAARVSAEWTAQQLTEENKTFLLNLPERLEMGECTLVHGSPYGPLWEYLTSEVLAERSFQHFNSRYCFVGHTHVPVIFQQPDTIANAPTLPLVDEGKNGVAYRYEGEEVEREENTDETAEMAVVQPQSPVHTTKIAMMAESAYADPTTGQAVSEEAANALLEAHEEAAGKTSGTSAMADSDEVDSTDDEEAVQEEEHLPSADIFEDTDAQDGEHDEDNGGEEEEEEEEGIPHEAIVPDVMHSDEISIQHSEQQGLGTPEAVIANAEDRLNSEIEELLTLLGLSESMIKVTNEMISPPIGHWDAPKEQRAIINPGGVGQPRDGDPRAAFMIYDTEKGFEFYRIPYAYTKTQDKIVRAGLPQYLAVRLAYGR